MNKSVYNVKRKMASLTPISQEIYETKVKPEADLKKNTKNNSSAGGRPRHAPSASEDSQGEEDWASPAYSSSDDDDNQAGELEMGVPAFVPGRCLFCIHSSPDLDGSLAHMARAHAFLVPEPDRLAVDVETLLGYLHLVVAGYGECLACGWQRGSAEAARQHMVDKGHCGFDIGGDSEFADFYEAASASEDEDGGDDDGVPMRIDDASLRLPSGKVLSRRTTAPHTGHRRPQHQQTHPSAAERGVLSGAETTPEGRTDDGTTTAVDEPRSTRLALTRRDRREAATAGQLAHLRAGDRTSLAHLPASEQRAVLAAQQRRADTAVRAERRYRSRVEGLGNRTLMKHFVPDVPGRKNG